MKKHAAEITLRPFERSDFKRLISWVPTPEAHGQWCGSFFGYPLDESRLQRYLESACQPNTRAIFTALLPSGEPVGHVEISQIWPYLSSRLSRVLVAPDRRQLGIGAGMVSRAVTFSFDRHHVDRIDLGVDADNVVAITCYRSRGSSTSVRGASDGSGAKSHRRLLDDLVTSSMGFSIRGRWPVRPNQ